MRLTLRTLLAYLDDTLPPAEAGEIGHKLAGTPEAQALVERIRTITRRRSLAPPSGDPNATADYLSDALPPDNTAAFEAGCLNDDATLAEVAACHQVLTLVLSEQVKVPPTARTRMYSLVKGQEAVPGRKPKAALSVAAVRDADPPDDAEADAQLLLGLPAYSASESAGRRAIRLVAVAAMLLGFGLCLWAAWPAGDGLTDDRPAMVMNAPAGPHPQATPTTAQTPHTKSETPSPVAPPPTAVEPDNSKDRKKEKKDDPIPPKVDRVPVGQLERPAGGATGLLLRRNASGDVWERVSTDPGGVVATDRLLCLPGYKASIRFDSGATADLWGNLPELVPVPVLATSISPALPSDGNHADLTIHAGRIYLGSKQADGVKSRLRFSTQAWDITLPDDKAEVVFELIHQSTPGEQPTVPTVTARLVTLNGPITVTPSNGDAFKLERYAGLAWTSAAGAKPQVLPPLSRAEREPLARLNIIPPGAQPILTALDGMAKRAAGGASVPAMLDELVQTTPDTRAAVPAALADNRVGVYGLAALGRADKLADLLASPSNLVGRQTAADALGRALLLDPELEKPARKVLVEQKRLSSTEADEVFRLLRGLTVAERTDLAATERLVADLQSPALPVRELALGTLIGLTPAEERAKVTVAPYVFDVAASEEDREAGVRAWKSRLEAIKKKTKGKEGS